MCLFAGFDFVRIQHPPVLFAFNTGVAQDIVGVACCMHVWDSHRECSHCCAHLQSFCLELGAVCPARLFPRYFIGHQEHQKENKEEPSPQKWTLKKYWYCILFLYILVVGFIRQLTFYTHCLSFIFSTTPGFFSYVCSNRCNDGTCIILIIIVVTNKKSTDAELLFNKVQGSFYFLFSVSTPSFINQASPSAGTKKAAR